MDATLLIVIDAGVIVARPKATRFVTSVALAEQLPLCIAVDPHRSGRIYCGTVAGLWRSDDMGQSWIPAGVNARDSDSHRSRRRNQGYGLRWYGAQRGVSIG